MPFSSIRRASRREYCADVSPSPSPLNRTSLSSESSTGRRSRCIAASVRSGATSPSPAPTPPSWTNRRRFSMVIVSPVMRQAYMGTREASMKLRKKRAIASRAAVVAALVVAASMGYAQRLSAQSLGGVWRVVSVVDYNADGSIRRYTYGRNPYGFVVASGGWCSIEIMATETPAYGSDKPIGDQMQPTLLSSFIGYAGPCTANEQEKFVV